MRALCEHGVVGLPPTARSLSSNHSHALFTAAQTLSHSTEGAGVHRQNIVQKGRENIQYHTSVQGLRCIVLNCCITYADLGDSAAAPSFISEIH